MDIKLDIELSEWQNCLARMKIKLHDGKYDLSFDVTLRLTSYLNK